MWGIVACAAPVAAFSSYSQFMTAHDAGMLWQLSWVLPMSTDATAFVATRTWLTATSRTLRRYAAGIVIICMGLSFLGAAMHLVTPASLLPWQLRLAIGGLPSLSLAALIHLGALVLAERRSAEQHFEKDARRPPRHSQRRSRGATQATESSRNPAGSVAAATETAHATAATTADPEPQGTNVVTIAGVSAKRDEMIRYLEQHPDATGAELDRRFGTKDYGRVVRRGWVEQRSRRVPASGE
jgi:hypothetical protein